MEGLQQNNLGSEQEVLDEERTVGYDASTKLQQQGARCAKITLYALLGSPSLGTMRV